MSPHPVKVREYKAADLCSVIETYTSSIRTLAAPYYSPEQISAWASENPDATRWQERLANLRTIVAESDGVLIGFASYTDEGYLDFLFTHPAWARRCVATSLLESVESKLRALGVRRANTHSSLAARAFFEARGFAIDHEETVECRGAWLRRFAMHKLLANV